MAGRRARSINSDLSVPKPGHFFFFFFTTAMVLWVMMAGVGVGPLDT